MSYHDQPSSPDTGHYEPVQLGGTGHAQPLWMDEKDMKRKAKRKQPLGFVGAKRPKPKKPKIRY